MQLKKLVLAGGTGFLGQCIIDHFRHTVSELLVLTRGENRKNGNVRYIHWDGQHKGAWAKELEGTDVLINLTGKSVDCRYTEKNKGEIIRSRVDATNVLGTVIAELKAPPELWMNAGSATIYRNAEDRAMDEDEGETGSGFSVEVCKLWEEAFNNAQVPQTRKVILRISMVLGNGGGVLPVLKKLVKYGLGGKMGNGNQYISWIHETDLINALEWLMEHKELSGPFNIAAPSPLPNKEFMKQMRETLDVPFGIPAASWMIRMGSILIRTEPELVLKSRRVVPKRLLDSGFRFEFPGSEEALNDLLRPRT